MTKKEVIYNGNEKQFFATEDPDKVIIRYKDVAVAFNNVKRARFEGKGALSNKISALLLGYLAERGIRNHFLERVGETEQLCRRIEILPIEVIVRLYEDHLENYTPIDGGTLKLTYDRIRKIYEGRHAIYLRLEGRFHVLLDPEHFTVGTAPEALAFLREKMNAE